MVGLCLILVLLVAARAFFWFRGNAIEHSDAQESPGKAGKAARSRYTLWSQSQAETGNIGVYVTGLGAITPIYTVTVKSRVDGQLMSVHFKEGDLVNQGDPLIEIDPRPYEAVVEQAQGQLTRDQALLANARVDLTRYHNSAGAGCDSGTDNSPRNALWSPSMKEPSQTIRDCWTRRSSMSLIATSPRQSRASWVCGWWTRAISSTPPIRTACS